MIVVSLFATWSLFRPGTKGCPDAGKLGLPWRQATINVKRAISRAAQELAEVDCLEGEEMSRKLNFIVALLILSSLCLGTLNALPLQPAPASVHEGGVLVAVMDWVASLFSLDRSQVKAPKPPRPTKYASQMDPNGNH
jgi:hypothetical protein